MTEKEKMLDGMVYSAVDKQLLDALTSSRVCLATSEMTI